MCQILLCKVVRTHVTVNIDYCGKVTYQMIKIQCHEEQ